MSVALRRRFRYEPKDEGRDGDEDDAPRQVRKKKERNGKMGGWKDACEPTNSGSCFFLWHCPPPLRLPCVLWCHGGVVWLSSRLGLGVWPCLQHYTFPCLLPLANRESRLLFFGQRTSCTSCRLASRRTGERTDRGLALACAYFVILLFFYFYFFPYSAFVVRRPL